MTFFHPILNIAITKNRSSLEVDGLRWKKSPFFGPRGIYICCSNDKGRRGTLLPKPIHDPPVGCGHSGPSRICHNEAEHRALWVLLSYLPFCSKPVNLVFTGPPRFGIKRVWSPGKQGEPCPAAHTLSGAGLLKVTVECQVSEQPWSCCCACREPQGFLIIY